MELLLLVMILWGLAVFVPILFSTENEIHYPWVIWLLASFIWIIPLSYGIHIKNGEGQYKGYVTAVEESGAIWKGWNVYLKTELDSSNEKKACINRDDAKLIDEIKEAQKNKENVVFLYQGVWMYGVGECPGASWMVIGIE